MNDVDRKGTDCRVTRITGVKAEDLISESGAGRQDLAHREARLLIPPV